MSFDAASAGAVEPISGFSVWLLGATLGMTACAVSCLPFIGTWAFGRGGQARTWDTAAFLGGRLIAYTLLGALAGGLGKWFVEGLAEGWGNFAIGVASLTSALWLAWPGGDRRGCAASSKLAGLSPVALGAALTLIPCAPLATLLSTCATGGDAWQGAAFGALFGTGALLTPMLILIPAAGTLARRIQTDRRWLVLWFRRGAALVLAVLGLRRMALVEEALAASALCFVVTLLVLAFMMQRLEARQRRTIPIRVVRE